MHSAILLHEAIVLSLKVMNQLKMHCLTPDCCNT